MAVNFTATLHTPGNEKGSAVFTNGGTSVPALTIIVNRSKCLTQDQALEAIKKLYDAIKEKNWPPA